MATIQNDLVTYYVAGENLADNDAVYVSTGTGVDSGRTAGRIYKLEIQTAGRDRFVGFVKGTFTSGNTAKVAYSGRKTGFTGLTRGQPIYAHISTAGSYQASQPTSFVQVLGIAQSTSEVLINSALGAGYQPSKLTLNKLDASVAPTASDDSADGYSIGSLWYDTTENTLYVCESATASAAVWQSIGGGGGSSSLSTIFQLKASESLGLWSTGDNSTFLGGGTLAGTFAKESSSPLSGTDSYKYTQAASSLDDYLASPVQSVDAKFRGKSVFFRFDYKYDGGNDIQPIIYDVTNASIISDTSARITTNSTISGVYLSSVVIPSNCTQVRFGFHVKTLNSGKILIFDDVQMSLDLFESASISNYQRYEISQAGSAMTDRSGQLEFNLATASISNSGEGFIVAEDDASNTRTKFVAKTRCAVTIVAQGRPNTVNRPFSIFKNNAQIMAGSYNPATDSSISTASTILEVGDYLSVFVGTTDGVAGDTVLNDSNKVNVTILAGAASQSVLIPNDQFSTDTASLVYAGSGSYTLSTLENAPVGTFITFTYASSSNTRTQTTTAPTQTTSDMNANGIRLYTRAYSAASTAASPAAVAIQIGKGLKGVSRNLYKSSGKVTSGNLDFSAVGTDTIYGALLNNYNESTGILYLDVGFTHSSANTTRQLYYSDLSTSTDGYVVINASKTPALTAVPYVQPRVALLRDVTTGAGGTFTSGSWVTRQLDTLEDPTGIVTSLSSNQFTLPSGTYLIEGDAPATKVDGHAVRLQNITAATTVKLGSLERAGNIDQTQTRSKVEAIVSIASPTVFELQHQCETTQTSNGLGYYVAFASGAYHAQVKITKLK